MRKKTKQLKSSKTEAGSALLLSTILLFVVLSMVISLTYITVMEQKMSQKTKSSVGSFFNADSGVEWALNKIANSGSSVTLTVALTGITTSADGAANCPFGGCKVYFLKDDGTVIPKSQFNFLTVADVKAVRSIGSQTAGEPTQRAIEAAVAAGGGGCYVSYGRPPLANRATSPNDNCVTGFTDKGSVGDWGFCSTQWGYFGSDSGFLPPAGSEAGNPSSFTCQSKGAAHVCCQ